MSSDTHESVAGTVNQSLQEAAMEGHAVVQAPAEQETYLSLPRPECGIDNIGSLREHLQWALQLEHATIPPYLCALYSLHEGRNQASAQVILSVAMEEMLHLTLAANVLNAIGGEPKIDDPKFVPAYPTILPHSDGAFKVNLLSFSPEAVETFLKIEKPGKGAPEAHYYRSIGQFYAAVEDGLKKVCADDRYFIEDHARQVTANHYYGGGGRPFAVTDLKSALRALSVIVDQGEGLKDSVFDDDQEDFGQEPEPSHYYRFLQIQRGRYVAKDDTPERVPTGEPFPVDWSAVYPMRANPHMEEYQAHPAIFAQMKQFNLTYTRLLQQLHDAFNGHPERLMEAVTVMYRLKYQAVSLMKMPAGHGGHTIGPSFEYTRDPVVA